MAVLRFLRSLLGFRVTGAPVDRPTNVEAALNPLSVIGANRR